MIAETKNTGTCTNPSKETKVDLKTREELLQRQREYVDTYGSCRHIVQCAITPEAKETALEMLREGLGYDALLAAMMLSGPCLTKES